MIALAISLVVIGAAASAFIQIIRASDEADAQMRAHSSARAAAFKIGEELRNLQLDTLIAYQQFFVIDRPLTYGDNIDNDGDGSVDEEIFDGFDDDGDWDLSDDRHAALVVSTERPDFEGVPDFGDTKVDEDVRFSADELSFIIPTGAANPPLPSPRMRVTYSIGSFEGVEDVLLRTVVPDPSTDPAAGGLGDTVVEPVIFDVVSFDVLAWNANSDSVGPDGPAPYWTSTWDARFKSLPLNPFDNNAGCPDGSMPATVPPFKLPASVLIRITVNAEREELAEIPNWENRGQPLKTVTIHTVVNLESVTSSTNYDCYVREGCRSGCLRIP